MATYIRITKPESVGGVLYKEGSVFKLQSENPISHLPDGDIYMAMPIFDDPLGFTIKETNFERLSFTPSPLYNHAVELGFNADPQFFQLGCIAILERVFSYSGYFPHNENIDDATRAYVEYDDKAKSATNQVMRDHYDVLARRYKWRVDILERLKGIVEKCNTAGTIENFKD